MNFRLLTDRENGKPKGYGFCGYQDRESAESAIRNLNGHDFHGRPLRVDFSDNHGERGGGPGNDRREGFKRSGSFRDSRDGREWGGGAKGDRARDWPREGDASRRQATGGGGVGADGKAYVAPVIVNIVQKMSQPELRLLVAEMKQFVEGNRERAQALLLENPALAQAMLQVLVLLGCVKAGDIHSLFSTPQPTQPPQQIPPAHAPHAHVHAPPPTHTLPPSHLAHAPPPHPLAMSMPRPAVPSMRPPVGPGPMGRGHPLPPPAAALPTMHRPFMGRGRELAPAARSMDVDRGMGRGMIMRPAPPRHAPLAPAPVTTPVAPAPAVPHASIEQQLPPEQREILGEVMRLSPEQIAQLPAEIRDQVFQLRQQLGH